MTARRKRSGRAVLAALSLALVGGCASGPIGPVPVDYGVFSAPVAVLTEPAEWSRGVHDHPLRPGEYLAFNFGREVAPTWTMDGVRYPLDLYALDGDGEVKEHLRMRACPSICPHYTPTVAAVVWIERRPASNSQ